MQLNCKNPVSEYSGGPTGCSHVSKVMTVILVYRGVGLVAAKIAPTSSLHEITADEKFNS